MLALAAATLFAPSLARAENGVTPAPHPGTRGVYKVGGVQSQPTTSMAATPSAGAASSNANIPGHLVDHGGPVMQSNHVYAVYWFPSGYTLSSSWRDIVEGFLGNVAADSGKTSNVFSDTEQYGVDYDATFEGSAVDTSPFPTSGCHLALNAKPCLTEAQIDSELASFAHSQGWSGDTVANHPQNLFIVYLPSGVADCFDNFEDICSANSQDPYYCAYHTSFTSGDETFVWANMPWSWDVSGCGGTSFPNGKTGDNAVNITSHEYIEALTDPYLNAWYDNGGYEVADKCQGTYGASVNPKQTGYNQLIDGGRYWLQLEYSNELSDCYQVGAPVISSVTPAYAAAAQTVHINGENFFGALTVKFAGITASIVTSSPTALTVRVPVGATYGKITVRAIGGTGVSPQNFGFGGQISALSPFDGKVGTHVTILGSGMTDVTSVKFGGVSTPFTIVDDGTITADVPSGFSSGKVTIGNAGGSSASSQTFQVTKVTGLTPLTAKAGETVLITGQGLKSATTVEFPGHTGGVPVTTTTSSTAKVVVPNDATFGPLTLHTPNIDAAGLATTSVFKATPTIASFTTDGKAGATVTITGANLSDATAVRFGTVTATTVDFVDASTITAAVPGGFSSGAITVVTPHGSAVTKTSFQVTKVSSFTPLSAAAGATVTITGQGLKSATAVDFAGALGVPVLTTSSGSVTVKIPAGASIGTLTVHTPNIDAGGIATAKPLKPLPRITGFDAASYQVGDLVTAYGTNLVETGSYTAKLGTVAISVSVSDGMLTFTVPAGAKTGSLTFANAAGSTTSTVHVHVRPTITSFSTGHAVTGTKVTLTGVTFTGTTGVTFGGAKASVFTVGAGGTTLVVTVPSAAVDGPVAVTNLGGTATSGSSFVVDPRLVSFSPASGAVGSTITFTGTGLKNVTRVDFGGGASATPVSTSAASLKVVVPAGATSGPIAVHATAADASAGTPFSVTFSVTSFSQPFGVPGATITISGVGLSSVTAVKFGVLSATISQKTGTSLRVVVPSITGGSTVSVTKGSTTIDAPSQFGLFAVTSASPHALTAGGTLTVAGSNLDGATAAFAGVDDPVTLADDGTATVPDGFTGGTVTIADAYGDAIDESIALFAVSSYDTSHAGPGETVSISLTDGGDYSSSTVHVKFAGIAAVAATGGDGSVSVAVPAGATNGAIQVEAGDSGWAAGAAFTVDRASVAIDEVAPGELELKATAAGGLGDTTVRWRQGGSTHTIALDPQDVEVGDLIDVTTGFELGELTIEVGTPLGREDGLALNDGGTPSAGFQDDVAALVSDGVWGSSDSFDWSALADGQSVGRVGFATPDDVANWAIGTSTFV